MLADGACCRCNLSFRCLVVATNPVCAAGVGERKDVFPSCFGHYRGVVVTVIGES